MSKKKYAMITGFTDDDDAFEDVVSEKVNELNGKVVGFSTISLVLNTQYDALIEYEED